MVSRVSTVQGRLQYKEGAQTTNESDEAEAHILAWSRAVKQKQRQRLLLQIIRERELDSELRLTVDFEREVTKLLTLCATYFSSLKQKCQQAHEHIVLAIKELKQSQKQSLTVYLSRQAVIGRRVKWQSEADSTTPSRRCASEPTMSRLSTAETPDRSQSLEHETRAGASAKNSEEGEVPSPSKPGRARSASLSARTATRSAASRSRKESTENLSIEQELADRTFFQELVRYTETLAAEMENSLFTSQRKQVKLAFFQFITGKSEYDPNGLIFYELDSVLTTKLDRAAQAVCRKYHLQSTNVNALLCAGFFSQRAAGFLRDKRLASAYRPVIKAF